MFNRTHTNFSIGPKHRRLRHHGRKQHKTNQHVLPRRRRLHSHKTALLQHLRPKHNLPRRQRHSNRLPRPIPRRLLRHQHHRQRRQHPHLQRRHAQLRLHKNLDRLPRSAIRLRVCRITARRGLGRCEEYFV